MENLNRFFDHTLLRSDATVHDIEVLCRQAILLNCHAVCVNSCHVPTAALLLQDEPVQVAAVCGFPLGAMSPDAKIFEADQACAYGADEIDVVMNIGWLKSGEENWVRDEIRRLTDTVHGRDALLKVIIETHLLTDEELKKACRILVESDADFVKTSTGLTGGGAIVNNIKALRDLVGSHLRIKASGGIRDRQTAESLIAAGADRIGASATVSILRSTAQE